MYKYLLTLENQQYIKVQLGESMSLLVLLVGVLMTGYLKEQE